MPIIQVEKKQSRTQIKLQSKTTCRRHCVPIAGSAALRMIKWSLAR